MNLTEVVIGLHIKGEPGIWRKAFPGGSDGKESACNAGDLGSHAWVGKIPRRREWQPTPVFFLENPTDRGAWWATVHGVAKSQTQLSN